MNLVESYKKRVQIAESVYANAHDGERMDNQRKIVLARCLKNLDAFLTESFNSTNATQRSDMGTWKKFCLNLTTVALPNLIANDLVIVQPMSSMSGYVTYIEYMAGTTKGETTQGDLFNSPFKLGNVDPRYTSNAVVEAAEAGTAFVPAWTPVATGAFTTIVVDGTEVEYDPRATYTAAEEATIAHKDYKSIASAGGAVTFGNFANGQIASPVAGKVAYRYDNITVPQNDLPTLKAEIKSIPLLARARRIAVYYSQIAAFQATTDYGINLGDQLAEKAVGQLSYEIDTEVTDLLIKTAGTPDADLVWSKTLPVGVNKRDHYAGFSEVVSLAAQKIYDRTKRFQPTYMLASSGVMPILNMMDGFTAASTANINGPYFAGTLNGLKVFVTPNMDIDGKIAKFCIGVNGSDMMSSVAVYAPYMPIVPTQLLQFNDGLTTQGWSTMYDLKVLNKDLIVAGEITA